jgi:hypothetical protein
MMPSPFRRERPAKSFCPSQYATQALEEWFTAKILAQGNCRRALQKAKEIYKNITTFPPSVLSPPSESETTMNCYTSPTLSRREILKLGGAAAIAGLAGSARWTFCAEAQTPSITPTMHVYPNYAWLRGFSVVPSWGARIEEAWWNYDGARFREEVSLARSVHANCIRLWIEFTAWMADPEKVTERFLDAVKAIDQQGMKTMPCLFNRWHDRQWDYGGLYTEDFYRDPAPKLKYVETLVKPLAADPRVLIWDLCNEPQAMNIQDDAGKREFEFLEWVAAVVRRCGARQPITIGTMSGKNIETFAPLCDVLCGHPYCHTPDDLKKQIRQLDSIAKKFGKPMLVNECIPGCLDDKRRAEVARYTTQTLCEAGFGWMGWALREGKAISTRRDRYDVNGLDGQGFHPFFTREGKLRGGLDFLCETPKVQPPWKK